MGRVGVTRLEQYRADMLARKAAKAGCTVAELIARGEREADINRAAYRASIDDAYAHGAIARGAAERGNTWGVGSLAPELAPEAE